MKKNSIDPETLVNKYGLLVSRVACRMIRNNEVAREAAQEVWYEILRKLDTFRYESSISTWIYTIARRTLIRYARNERIYRTNEINEFFGREEIPVSADAGQDKEDLVKEMCDGCLTAFCHCLSNEARLVYLFRVISELSYREIASVMEMNETGVRKMLSRSKVKVRHFMKNNCVLYNPKGKCKCRIQKHVKSVDLPKVYSGLSRTMKLIDFYLRFDQELPRKNFWEKKLEEVVTN
jgi:RNA polymerase sigma factor (sigma-70 family)